KTDGARASVRIVLVDYQKVFDHVDHTIVLSKLKALEIPDSTVSWIANFLSDRQQRTKLGHDCFSEWGNVPAGVPQRTKLGSWLFILMINDLKALSEIEEWSENPFPPIKINEDTSLNYQLRINKKIHVPKFCTELLRILSHIISCNFLNYLYCIKTRAKTFRDLRVV
ncbi:Hypothetical predicted protein, partial [Paramuricea clavata]